MKIGNRLISAEHPPYVIAELGVNHDGSVDRALELVGAAQAAGADAIKLQLFDSARLLSRAATLAAYQKDAGAGDPFSMLRGLELTIDSMRAIVSRAHQAGLHAIVTVFSVELVEPAQRLRWDAYKTASPDIVNRPLLRALMATGRPLLVSAGAATLEEVRQSSRWLADHPHLIMQCVSAYPTPDEHASIGGLRAMQRVDASAIGYSDHTCAVDAGALAVAAGACILEKHLTYDRNAAGPDHAASLDPQAFAEYVRLAQRAFAMVGPPVKQVLDIEQDVRKIARQSITTLRALPLNHVIAREDVTIKRPGVGLSPSLLDEIIGRRTSRTVEADMPLLPEDLA